ncbi:uncharacterized protein LOC126897443 [Daktulosphaira vitifoliae]|uniref:uncharacterized protein LOC126897443 n=1 Tax=Daktulosphaira vitifoliae TaxID=58002 RepID=UPI0021AA7CF7|nr:uncharacterized protein LOC126897443 [Daktulosphaira vitifoliae]
MIRIWLPFLCYNVFFRATALQTFEVTDTGYFDLEVAGKQIGRMEIGLFGRLAPKTVENFITILTKGIDGQTYVGTRFHRILKGLVIQGGDIVNNDGSGSISIYGDTFPDEILTINHTEMGFVGMANSGPDTNGCQFYITTKPLSRLDGKHVVFGKLVNGLDILYKIEHLPTDAIGRPNMEIRIKSCGLLEKKPPYTITDHSNKLELWKWIKASSIPLTMSTLILGLFQWMIIQMNKVIN